MGKRLLAFLFCVLLCLVSVGCGDDHQDAILYMELPEKPYTLDPQTASTDAELMVVRNIFEGLLRKNGKGEIVCGAAEKMEIQDKTYTFTLRKDLCWNDQTPITSDDFLFAFQRAVSAETQAPFVFRLFSIQNAESIYKGKKTLDQLGVTAPDDRTLVIRLSKQDADFEETLTTSVAMPCRRTFFEESAGYYGLQGQYLLSNGSYRLSKWSKDPFGIRLYRNLMYKGIFVAQNAAVYRNKNDEKPPVQRLIDHNVDATLLDPSLEPVTEENGLHMVEIANTCWVLTIRSDFSRNLRKAFVSLTGSEVYGNDLPHGYEPTDSLYPSVLQVNDQQKTIRSTYDLSTGKTCFTEALKDLPDRRFPSGVTLSYYDNGVIKPIVTDLVGHWQNNLGAFVNIAAYDDLSVFSGQLKTQTLDFAIFPVQAKSRQVTEYLENFGENALQKSPTAFEKSLLKTNTVIPLLSQTTAVAYSNALECIWVDTSNGYLDFSWIIKTE